MINKTEIHLFCDPVTNILDDSLVGTQAYYIASFVNPYDNKDRIRTYFTSPVGDLMFFQSIDDAIDHAKENLPVIYLS